MFFYFLLAYSSSDAEEYARHLANNAIPMGFENMDYFEFLEARRKLMAGIIKKAIGETI